jgi:hypothetical protein
MGFSVSRVRRCLTQPLDRRDVLGFAGALFAATAFNGTSRAADPAGRVEEVKGEAFANASNQNRPLERSSSIFVGDRVATGSSSRLTMLLGADTTIRLGERANLVIDKFLVEAGGEISLESGPMLFDRPAGSRPVPMQFKSSYGLIAVRGTRFFAGPSNGVFGVFVDRGTVQVSGGGGEVVLTAGQGTDVRSPGSRPTPSVVWGAERVRRAFDSVN